MVVFPISSLVMLWLSLFIFHALPIGDSALSFSAELIHRDSPESPLYDPTSTPFSRFRAAVNRSATLANYFHDIFASANNSRLLSTVDRKSIHQDGLNNYGTYLTKVELGTPIQTVFVTINTVGRLNWVMCNPCETCGKRIDMLFNHSASSTYKTMPCDSDSCESIRRFPCSNENSICKYEQHYGKKSTASGLFSEETLHFRSMTTNDLVSVPGILFGCTHKIGGKKFMEELATGYIVLNDHKLSFINQIYNANQIPRKFSYCLPREVVKHSRMYFGDTPPPKDLTSKTTLFIGQFTNLYSLYLKKISVFFLGSTALHIAVGKKGPHSSIDGNIMIDSGSTITFIKDEIMKRVSRAILSGMPRKQVAVPEGLGPIIELCFNWSEPDEDVLPTISFVFENGAKIFSRDAFVEVEKGILCLFMASDKFSKGVQVLGNVIQLGHSFVFDLNEREVTINLDDCNPQ